MPSTHLHAVQISKVIYPSRLEAEEVARMYGAVEGMLSLIHISEPTRPY